jgi:hypothetical protein
MKAPLLASALGVGLVAACSTSKSSPPSDNPTTVASTEAGTLSSPPTPGDEACNAIIAFDQRCSDTPEVRTQACADARKATCSAMTKAMGDAYRVAVIACFTASVACGDTDACIAGRLSGVQPSGPMLRVRDDYCATCKAEAGPTCADDFYKISNDTGNGDGFLILQVSDDIARSIDAKCTGAALKPADFGATTCREGFLYCATSEAQNAGPGMPDQCAPPPPPDTPPPQDDGGLNDGGP